MSEEVKNFVDQLAAGDNAGAGEAFKDALRVKVGTTLDAHRKNTASNMLIMLCQYLKQSHIVTLNLKYRI